MQQTTGSVVKSAGRVLAILEFFDHVMQPATAAEIRSHLQIPASSATALLRSLVDLGYLHYDSRKRSYRPTLRVGLLGEWTQSERLGGRHLWPLIEELGRETGRLVVIGTRCRLSAQYIQVMRPSEQARPVRPGTLAPLTRTAVGWVLMSRLHDTQITRLVHHINAEGAADQRISPLWLIDKVREVRQTGFAFCYGRVTPSVGAIGMAIPTTRDEPPIVIAVSGSGPDFVAQKEALVATMRDRVHHYLGSRPEFA